MSENLNEYTREEMIEKIEENSQGGKTPEVENLDGISQEDLDELFGGYLNAVFMARKTPEEGWRSDDADYTEEIVAEYLHFTREDYWQDDQDDRWGTEAVTSGRYLKPVIDESPFSKTELDEIRDQSKEIPEMGITVGFKPIDLEVQKTVMKLVSDGNTGNYSDLEEQLEWTDIETEVYKLKKLLDPGSDRSYGRWMSEEELP